MSLGHSNKFKLSYISFSVPGTISVHGAPIQILDLPGIIEGAKDGRGRGRQVIAGKSHDDLSVDVNQAKVLLSSRPFL
jgi:ribosome-interacting GTPase 1